MFRLIALFSLLLSLSFASQAYSDNSSLAIDQDYNLVTLESHELGNLEPDDDTPFILVSEPVNHAEIARFQVDTLPGCPLSHASQLHFIRAPPAVS